MATSGLIYVNSQTITAGATPQRVLSGGTGPGADLPSTVSISVKARKSNTSPLYLGMATSGGGTNGSGLLATNGYELQPGEGVALDLMGPGSMYILGATTGDRYDILGIGP